MSEPNFTPEAIKALRYLLDGRGKVSIEHDRPPNGSWFIEVTDTWTDMVTRMFAHPELPIALMKVVNKKAKVLGIDSDDIMIDDPVTEEEEEPDYIEEGGEDE